MEKQQINYADYTLDPQKPVEVPINVWSTLYRVISEVSKKENTSVIEYVYSYYHKETGKKLSSSGKSKMSAKKLEENYRKDIDLEATRKNVKLQTSTDGLGMVALELLAAFDAVFKSNVDNGNRIQNTPPSVTPPNLSVETNES